MAGLLGGMDEREFALCCCCCCTLVVAAGAFWGSETLLLSPAIMCLTFGWANGLKKSVMLRFGFWAMGEEYYRVCRAGLYGVMVG